MDESGELKLIRASILALDEQFQEFMCTIPSKYYVAQQQLPLTSFDETSTNGQKSRKKKKKVESNIDPEFKRLQKRAKYDPESLPTIPQLQGLNKTGQPNSKSNTQSNKTSENSTEASDDQEDSRDQKDSTKVQLSRAELQAKLQKRIESLQGHASKKQDETGGDGVSSKDDLLDLERKKRGEKRDRRRKERKEARRKEKQLKLEEQSKKKKGFGSSNSSSSAHPGSGNLQKGVRGPAQSEVQASEKASKVDTYEKVQKDLSNLSSDNSGSPCIANQALTEPIAKISSSPDPDLVFSALSFHAKTPSEADGLSHSSKHKKPSLTSRDPKEAKIALMKREKYLEKLKPEARERAEESKKWEKANLEASGSKVMDDMKKIDRSIKRLNKEKKKKKLEWDQRIKVVEKLKEDKLKKRNENIQLRKDQIRQKKLGQKGVKAKGNAKQSSGKKQVRGF